MTVISPVGINLNKSIYPYKDLHIDVDSFVYCSQKLETTQKSNNVWLDKQMALYPYKGMDYWYTQQHGWI